MFEIPFAIIKILNIAFLSMIQFSFAIIINIILDKIFLPESEIVDERPNVFIDFVILCIIIAFLVSFAYIGKNITKYVPSPFQSWEKIHTHKFQDLSDISALTSFFLLTSGIVERRISSIRNYFGLNTVFLDINKNGQDNVVAANK